MTTWWSRLVCWWKGHTFKVPDKVNYIGSIGALLYGCACERCKRSYAELWNAGELR